MQEDGSVTETVVEPEGEVRIRIEYRKDVELQENTEVEAIHFVNENGEAETPEEKEQKTPEELARQIAEQEKPQMIDSETEGTDGSVKVETGQQTRRLFSHPKQAVRRRGVIEGVVPLGRAEEKT